MICKMMFGITIKEEQISCCGNQLAQIVVNTSMD